MLTHEHSDCTKLNLHNLKLAADRLETHKDSNTERKTWQVHSLGKRTVLRFFHILMSPERVSV